MGGYGVDFSVAIQDFRERFSVSVMCYSSSFHYPNITPTYNPNITPL